MKHFKISFAASASIIAVIFSLTASGKLSHKTTIIPEDYCYVSSIQSNLTCTSPTTTISIATSCVISSAYVNRPLLNISTASRFPIIDIDITCIGGSIFCCAEIRRMTTAICATPPQPTITIDGVISYFKISAIHCMN